MEVKSPGRAASIASFAEEEELAPQFSASMHHSFFSCQLGQVVTEAADGPGSQPA